MCCGMNRLWLLSFENHKDKLQSVDAYDQKGTSSQSFVNTARRMGEWIPHFSPHDLDIPYFILAQQPPQLVGKGKESRPHCLKAAAEKQSRCRM